VNEEDHEGTGQEKHTEVKAEPGREELGKGPGG